MNPHLHIQNLLEILGELKNLRRLEYQKGSPTDKWITAAHRAVIEWKKSQEVQDVRTEEADGVRTGEHTAT